MRRKCAIETVKCEGCGRLFETVARYGYRFCSRACHGVFAFGSLIERIWSGFVRDDASGCWEWQKAIDSRGYPMVRVGGPQQKAHRIAWAMANGREIPPGMVICHRCDNRRCINPDHLFLGTQKDNVADCVSKGRRAILSGEANVQARLNDGAAAEIRRRYVPGVVTQDALAIEYGVHRGTIGKVVRGERWTHGA